jgi:hypothetical protein
LLNLRVRVYDPPAARFISADGFGGVASDPPILPGSRFVSGVVGQLRLGLRARSQPASTAE